MSRVDIKTSKLALCGIACAVSVVVSVAEQFIPIQAFIPLPGIKLGFANIVVLFLLYRFGFVEAFAVSLIRCVVVNLLFGSVTGLLFSLSGAVLSILCGLLLKHTAKDRLSFIGVSVLCAASHNTGQILASCAVLSSFAPLSYLPVLLFASVITGSVTGTILNIMEKHLRLK